MAKQVKLTAERRTTTGRSAVRKLKAIGVVPAVIYGAKDKAEPLQVSRRDINALLSHAAGENILVELEIAGKSRLALVQEVQHAPLGNAILHIDFHAVSMDEVIQADVPLEPAGVANGVKNMAACSNKTFAPRDRVPTAGFADLIKVDVPRLMSAMPFNRGELQLPSGVTTRVQPDLTAFSVLAPTVEEEPVAAG